MLNEDRAKYSPAQLHAAARHENNPEGRSKETQCHRGYKAKFLKIERCGACKQQSKTEEKRRGFINKDGKGA